MSTPDEPLSTDEPVESGALEDEDDGGHEPAPPRDDPAESGALEDETPPIHEA